MSVNKELVKGSTSMLVLGVLRRRKCIGYQIIKNWSSVLKQFFPERRNTLSDSSCVGAGWLSGSILGGYELSEKAPLL